MSLFTAALLALSLPAHAGSSTGEISTYEYATPGPEPKRRVAPRYPDDLSFQVEKLSCAVEMTVEADGTVSEVVPTDCFPGLFEHTRSAAMKWTFEPATEGGQPVASSYRLRLNYSKDGRGAGGQVVSAEQFEALKAAHAPLASTSEHCQLEATLHPDGAISGLGASNFPVCMVIPTHTSIPGNLGSGSDQACQVSLKTWKGLAADITAVDCPKETMRAARKVLRSWAWNGHSEEARTYEVSLTFSASPAPGT